MTRIALICLALAACSSSSGSKLDDKPTPPPRNLVCERVAIIQAEATRTVDTAEVAVGEEP